MSKLYAFIVVSTLSLPSFGAPPCRDVKPCVMPTQPAKPPDLGTPGAIRSDVKYPNCTPALGVVCRGTFTYQVATSTQVASLVRFQASSDGVFKVRWKCMEENNIVVVTLKTRASASQGSTAYLNCSNREWRPSLRDLPGPFSAPRPELTGGDVQSLLIAVEERPAIPQPDCLRRVIIAEAYLPGLKHGSSWLILYNNRPASRMAQIDAVEFPYGNGVHKIDDWGVNDVLRCLRIKEGTEQAAPAYELVF